MARRAPVFDAIAGLAHEMPLIGAMAMRNFTDILALLKKGRQLNATDEARIRPTVLGICDMIGPLPDQPCLHLDRGYDSTKTRDLLEILGYDADIATKGVPAPIQAGKRWPVERTHS